LPGVITTIFTKTEVHPITLIKITTSDIPVLRTAYEQLLCLLYITNSNVGHGEHRPEVL